MKNSSNLIISSKETRKIRKKLIISEMRDIVGLCHCNLTNFDVYFQYHSLQRVMRRSVNSLCVAHIHRRFCHSRRSQMYYTRVLTDFHFSSSHFQWQLQHRQLPYNLLSSPFRLCLSIRRTAVPIPYYRSYQNLCEAS